MSPFQRETQAGSPADPRHRSRGQSFVEFAVVLPVILLLTMTALDFGRVYLGWINLQNMARAAANYAANNPTAWLTNDTATILKYTNQVINDAAASNCQLNPVTPAAPTFSDTNGNGITTDIGDHVTVGLTCSFQVITPIISNVLGGTVNLSSAAVFPVKNGLTGLGGGTGCILPAPAINALPGTSGTAPLAVTFTDASGGAAGTSWLWDFGDPSATVLGVPTPTSTLQNPGTVTYHTAGTFTVTLAVTNSCGTVTANPAATITVGSATGQCTVPVLDGLKRNKAQEAWGLPKPPGAGFTTTVQDGPGAPSGNGWTILTQSIVSGGPVDCGSTIFVNDH